MVWKIILNPRYLHLVLERKIFDWSFLPVVCWTGVFLSLLRFIFLRYVRRKPSRSFYPLLGAQSSLLKVPYREVSASRLKRTIAKAIRRYVSDEGSEYFHLPEDERVFERDIQYIKKCGGIVLKKPRFTEEKVAEKGALMLNHAMSFQFFCCGTDVPSFLKHYVLILETGWSGYTDPTILYFTRYKDHPIIVLAPEKRDYDFLKALGTNLIPVSFGCSEWVHPSIFRPFEDQEKQYDVVFVATWVKFKRHHVLFNVLRELRDPSFRVALVSRSSSNRKEIELLADVYGVKENLFFFEGLTQEELNSIFNQSKVNLLLSLQEGGNRALFEGFFAGVPGLALRNNIGIPKDYFTPQTGKLISEKDLKSELLYFREHWADFHPRPWAKANITPEITTSKLNELLKGLAHQRGEEWTQDLVAKSNSPNFVYYPREDVGRGMPTYEDILCQYARSKKIVDRIRGS